MRWECNRTLLTRRSSLILSLGPTRGFSRLNLLLDHYKTLGLSPSASHAQIKETFYRLSKEHHPDKNPHASSAERYKEISAAYTVIGNEESRREYDTELGIASAGQRRRAGDYGPSSKRTTSNAARHDNRFYEYMRDIDEMRADPRRFYNKKAWTDAHYRQEELFREFMRDFEKRSEDGFNKFRDAGFAKKKADGGEAQRPRPDVRYSFRVRRYRISQGPDDKLFLKLVLLLTSFLTFVILCESLYRNDNRRIISEKDFIRNYYETERRKQSSYTPPPPTPPPPPSNDRDE